MNLTSEPLLGRRRCIRARQRAVDALRAARRIRRRVWTGAAGRAAAAGVRDLRRALQVSPRARPRAARSTRSTSVPRWDGLWVTAGNTHMNMFIDPPGFTGKVRAGVLTPPYEAAYQERWRQQQELGEVQYDRLTHCEPPGYPRWLLEPYSHEFLNLPHQSYLINDFGPAIRRVYIGQEHKNVYGTHSWYGDTIGFWDGDKLVTHTKYLLPADFTRWSPMTSNQFESVETWELKRYPGRRRAARGAGHLLRSPRLRQARQRRLRVPPRRRSSRRPAIASSTGSARRATTTSSTRGRRRRSCRARRGSRTRAGRRSFRICPASRAIRSTTPRFRAEKE